MKFYLGTHVPNWVWSQNDKIPLFISNRTLSKYKKLHKAKTSWSLDSGGFSELSLFNTWKTTAKEYISNVKRYNEEISNLDFVCIQDWMCEPFMLEKTGLSVKEHQKRTVNSLLELRSLYNKVYFIPIIQGFTQKEYLECIDLYYKNNIDLHLEDTVGLGSVCRRQNSEEIANLIKIIHAKNIKLHGFGVKKLGLKKIHKYLKSSDSLAWSFRARYQPPMIGCLTHKNCANCYKAAIQYYTEIQNITNEKI